MKLTIKTKLLLGFGVVLALIALVSISSFIKIGAISNIEQRLTSLRLPTEMAGQQLTDGIHLSVAGLRGYMLLGRNPKAANKFKAERQRGWDRIDDALAKMNTFSKSWTDPENIRRLNKIKALAEQLRSAQQSVENISHTPSNIPSLYILHIKAAPLASEGIGAMTAMINEEANLPATVARKHLLKLLADSRGSFAVGLADIRAYLFSGDTAFADRFRARWATNQARYKQISAMAGLFDNTQRAAWTAYKRARSGFTTLLPGMFKARSAKDWNLANYWLATKAAPKAAAIMGVLAQMRTSQEQFSRKDTAALEGDITSANMTLIIGTLIAIGIGLFMAIFISRMISVPLSSVVARAKAIASGDLTGADLTTKSNDELAELAHAINEMKSGLHDIIRHVMGSTDQLASAAEEMSAVTAQTSQGIAEQQSQTEQVATAMNQMTATVGEVARHAGEAAGATNHASEAAVSGKNEVDCTVRMINDLACEVEKAAGEIHELESDSVEIGSVLDVIRGIAEQTNLLALNAAIEAARAGEQGRGFAVVADEVRTLASRTQQSTQEIQTMIERLQNGTRNVVHALEERRAQAQTSVEQAAKAGTSLEAITEAVTNISDMNLQIASAAEEQSQVAEEINRNIITISEVADKSAQGGEQTAQASEDLARLASDLQNTIVRFKV